jgi:hypothetical protein
VPGNGFRVNPGVGKVFNKYQTPVRESYVVSAPTVDTFGSGGMPAPVASTRSHLVAVTVADPQYSNSGHPWFPSTWPGLNDPLTYQYVRTWLFQNVPAGSGQAWLDANFAFPAMALARLDMPASSTTVGTAQIIDLREMAQPRSKTVQWNFGAPAVADVLTVAAPLTWEYWPDTSDQLVAIPSWASMVYVVGYLTGFNDLTSDETRAEMRVGIQTAGQATGSTKYRGNAPGRFGVNLGGPIALPAAIRGTSQHFQVQATVQDTASQGDLNTDAWTSGMIQLRFVEEPD